MSCRPASRGVTRQCAPCCTRPLPSCCGPLPNVHAQCPALACAAVVFTPAEALLRRLNTLPGTLVGARKTTPFGSSSVPPGLANHTRQTHYCPVHASLGLRTFSPTCPTTIMLVAAHPGPPRPRHKPFSSLLSFPPQIPDATHLYRVAGDASSSNVGPALPHS